MSRVEKLRSSVSVGHHLNTAEDFPDGKFGKFNRPEIGFNRPEIGFNRQEIGLNDQK